jgi:hypothetical protein
MLKKKKNDIGMSFGIDKCKTMEVVLTGGSTI